MPKSTTRSSADEIRAAIAAQIRNNFDYRNVRGLAENPTVTQNPTRQTKEPYIYVYSIGQVEIDSTKDDTPFQYQVAIEVTLRYSSYRGGQRQAEEIMNEVFAYVRGKNASEYPDLSAFGFNVYNTTTGDTEEFTDRLRGANYYRVVTSLYVTASFTGQEVQVQPVQDPEFTYDTFAYTPTNNNIERYDAGNIIPAQTYISPNNGWSFSSVDYSLPSNAEGVYNGTDYTLTSTNEPIAIDSTINYDLVSDNNITTALSATTSWSRIDSIRYGSVPASAGLQPTFPDDTSATYGLRLLSNWNVEFGTTDPQNQSITITGDKDEYTYIIVNDAFTLNGIRDSLGTNNINNFDVVTDGNYRYYISKTPILFDNSSFTYTLST